MHRLLHLLLAAIYLASTGGATWSVVVANLRTGEVAVGVATCLENFNLRHTVPVLVPELGAAASQCLVDSGANRETIHTHLKLGTDLDDLLVILDNQDSAFQFRQYGIVDMQGRAVTHTGNLCGEWKGGITGRSGDLVYAIQGNVLTGLPVVLEAEQALLQTPGDLAEKLMAAMEAARDMGGDGRCSCDPFDPPACGSPPPNFNKSSHVATMVMARPGDPVRNCNQNGRARGDLYMVLNIHNRNAADPDPVDLLRQEYDLWRGALRGRPDAMHSLVALDAESVEAGSADLVEVLLDLRDVDGVALTQGGATIQLVHDARSARQASLFSVTDHQDGTYTLELQPGAQPGLDILRFKVDDGVLPVTLWPPSTLLHTGPAPLPFNNRAESIALNPGTNNAQPYFLPNGLAVYFLSDAAGVHKPILRAERASTQDPFGAPVVVPMDQPGDFVFTDLTVTGDELELVLSGYELGSNTEQIFTSIRSDTASSFPRPVLAESLASVAGEGGPHLAASGRELYFYSFRDGGADLWHSWRPDSHGVWFPPRKLEAQDPAAHELFPTPSRGGSRLSFTRQQVLGGAGSPWYSLRQPDGSFAPGAPLPGALHPPSQYLALGAEVLAAGEMWLSGGLPGASKIFLAEETTGALTASTSQLSAAQGGAVDFQLDAGVSWAQAQYSLLAAYESATPGAEWLDGVLPFAFDELSSEILQRPQHPALQAFQGQLDASGQAQAQLMLPAGAIHQANWLGRSYCFAFVAEMAGSSFISDAVKVELLP